MIDLNLCKAELASGSKCLKPKNHSWGCSDKQCESITQINAINSVRCQLGHLHNTLNHVYGNLAWTNIDYKPEVPKLGNGYSHYFKDVTKYTHIDVYRVLELFSVTDPCIQHAVKKLLVAGGRGSKDMTKDIEEAIVSLKRWQQMRTEDETSK